MRGKRFGSGIVAALMAAMLLSACGGGTSATTGGATASQTTSAATKSATTTAAAKKMTVAVWSAPDGFNPVTAQSGYDDSVIALMFDTLDWQSPDQKFHPLLASSWDVSKDFKTFTFHIDPKAQWSDGKPVTAQDVAYTFQISTNPKVPATFGSFLNVLVGTNAQGQNVDPGKPLAGVKVIDSKTIQLRTKAPTDPNLLLYNIGANIWIVPQHALSGITPSAFAKAPFFQHPNVTDGPYTFVKYLNSQYVQLAPNPNYYLGAPALKQLYVKVVPATSMLAELRDGEIDATMAPGESDVPLQDWPAVAKLSNVKQDPVPGTTNQFMEINTAKKYLASASVRQAISMAINRQEIVTQLLKGQGSIPIGPVSPLYSTWYDKSIKPWPYDPTKAKAMLQAAHFPFSQQLLLLVPTGNQIRQESAPLIQQDLQQVGLHVRVQQYDFGTLLAQVRKGNFDFALIGSGFGVDPSGSALFFTCKGSLNFNHFCDPAVDAAYRAGATTAVTAQRQKAYDTLQSLLHKDAPFVFLYYANGLMAYNTGVDKAAIPNAYGMQQSWLWNIR